MRIQILMILGAFLISGCGRSRAITWDFVSSTGGMSVDGRLNEQGGALLVLEYDVSGLGKHKTQATLLNSNISVHKVATKWKDGAVYVQFFVGTLSHKYPQDYIFVIEMPKGQRAVDVYYHNPDGGDVFVGKVSVSSSEGSNGVR